ncbi:MAG: TraR/DksA C4-type zinc finger protein [Deltaproteobacteria bacterium]|nr:TraR/DksA C4-type zinc finger protein [Deltaproteobacteria bacterium]
MNKQKMQKFEKVLRTQLEELYKNALKVADSNILSDEKKTLDEVDLASIETDWINSIRIKDREKNLILKIQQALKRVTEGTFGICLGCGDDICEKRLLARPVTTHCIDCKQLREDRERMLSA